MVKMKTIEKKLNNGIELTIKYEEYNGLVICKEASGYSERMGDYAFESDQFSNVENMEENITYFFENYFRYRIESYQDGNEDINEKQEEFLKNIDFKKERSEEEFYNLLQELESL